LQFIVNNYVFEHTQDFISLEKGYRIFQTMRHTT